jgi:hypothetical protein
MGQSFLVAAHIKYLRAYNNFIKRVPANVNQLITEWQDPDALFDAYLQASGDGFVNIYPAHAAFTSEFINTAYGPHRLICPNEWYLPSKGRFTTYPASGATLRNSTSVEGLFSWTLQNGMPGQLVSISVSGGAFGPTTITTSNNGFGHEVTAMGAVGFTPGTYTLRYKANNEVYGPFEVTLIGPQTIYTGNINMSGASIEEARHATVISNTTMVVSATGNYVRIAGTNTMSRMANTDWQGGSIMKMYMEGQLTVNHAQTTVGANVPFMLEGNVNALLAAGSTLSVVYDDVSLAWVEIARANSAEPAPPTVPVAAVQADQETIYITHNLCFTRNTTFHPQPQNVG